MQFVSQKNIGLKDERILFFSFDCSHLCALTGLWIERVFNLNNEIIQYYIHQNLRIIQQQDLFNLFKDFFKECRGIIYEFHSYSGVKNINTEIEFLNSILEKINKISGTAFKLSKTDFPNWMNEMIQWTSIK
jgi:hypothetical protein